MAITIRSSFKVDANPADAWRTLTDIERAAPCFPGAELKEQQPDGSYKGGFTVKLGPLTFKFNGKFKIAEQDDVNRTMVVTASGTDTKGRGGADANINVSVGEEGGKTKVDVVSEVNLSGTVAQYGRGVGMIEALSQQLLNHFAVNLAAQIGADAEEVDEHVEPEAEPMGAMTEGTVSHPAGTPPADAAPQADAAAVPTDAFGATSTTATTASVAKPVPSTSPTAPASAAVPAPAEPSQAASAPVAPSQAASSQPAPAQAAPQPAAPKPAAPKPAPRPRPAPAPVVPLDAGALMRKAMWQSFRNFFAGLFGSKKK
jgi:carbon monoxide dehydrogenase subunit G